MVRTLRFVAESDTSVGSLGTGTWDEHSDVRAVLWARAFKVWVCSNLGWYQSGIEMVGHPVAVGEMLLANTAANGIASFPSPQPQKP